MNTHKSYMVFIGLLFCVLSVFSQRTELKFKGEIFDRNQVEKIIFNNGEGNIIKEFSIDKNNPYKSLRSNREIIKRESPFDLIKVENVTVKNFIKRTEKYKSSKLLDKKVSYITTPSVPIEDRNKNVWGVVYKLNLLNEHQEKVGSSAQIYVFDSKGGLTNIIETKTGVHSVAITEDGKYLGFSYGGPVGHDFNEIYDDGFSVYNAETGELLFDHVVEEGYTSLSPHSKFNYLMLAFSGSDILYHIIDPTKRICYKKKYSNKEVNTLISKTQTGFVFEINGITKTDKYEENFTKLTF